MTVLFQLSSVGFLNVLLRITDLFNFLASVKRTDAFYKKIAEKPWLKYEGDTFDYGFYYANYTTLINIVVAFG
jgi:hypothetical protein